MVCYVSMAARGIFTGFFFLILNIPVSHEKKMLKLRTIIVNLGVSYGVSIQCIKFNISILLLLFIV